MTNRRPTLNFATLAFLLVALIAGPSPAWAQDEGGGGDGGGDDGGREVDPGNNPTNRRGQTTMKFLSVSLDARAASMGSAMTAQELGAVSMFYNPAGMARLEETASVTGGQVQWIGGFNYNYAGGAFALEGGRYGVVGISVRSGDYGDFIRTIRDGSRASGYRELGTFSPTTLAFGASYARALTDRFSVGVNLKYATQDLGLSVMAASATTPEGGGEAQIDELDFQGNEEGTVVADFGMLYRTGFRSLNFAASVRNFSRELEYADKQVELPLMLQIGVSMDLVELTSLDQQMHALKVGVDASRPRDYFTNVRVGGEYEFMGVLALRAGYVQPHDIRGVSFGGGLDLDVGGLDLRADYGYTQYEVFDDVNRISVQLGF